MDPFDPYSPFKFLIFYYSSDIVLGGCFLCYPVETVRNLQVLQEIFLKILTRWFLLGMTLVPCMYICMCMCEATTVPLKD